MQTLALLLLTVVGWAGAFPAIRVALPAYGPVQLSLARLLVASFTLGDFVAALAPALLLDAASSRRDVPMFALAGLLGFAGYYTLLGIGEQTVASGPAAFLVQTAPVWTTVLAALLLGESVTPRGWIGVGIATFGAAILASGAEGGLHFSRHALLILGSSWSISGYVILQKRLLARYGFFAVAAWSQWFGTLWMLPFVGGLWKTVQVAPAAATQSVVFLGVVPSALAYIAWSAALAKLPVSRAVTALYGVPVLATVLAWWWLGEKPPATALLGGCVALCGVALVNTKVRGK